MSDDVIYRLFVCFMASLLPVHCLRHPWALEHAGPQTPPAKRESRKDFQSRKPRDEARSSASFRLSRDSRSNRDPENRIGGTGGVKKWRAQHTIGVRKFAAPLHTAGDHPAVSQCQRTAEGN